MHEQEQVVRGHHLRRRQQRLAYPLTAGPVGYHQCGVGSGRGGEGQRERKRKRERERESCLMILKLKKSLSLLTCPGAGLGADGYITDKERANSHKKSVILISLFIHTATLTLSGVSIGAMLSRSTGGNSTPSDLS